MSHLKYRVCYPSYSRLLVNQTRVHNVTQIVAFFPVLFTAFSLPEDDNLNQQRGVGGKCHVYCTVQRDFKASVLGALLCDLLAHYTMGLSYIQLVQIVVMPW